MYKEKNTHLGSYQLLMHSWILYSDPEAQVHRKKAGGFRGQLFSEGLIMVQCSNMDCLFYTIVYEMFINFFRWVEFAKKSIAKRVADMLNGEQIGIFVMIHFSLFIVNRLLNLGTAYMIINVLMFSFLRGKEEVSYIL